jgi:hypothetical protein
MSQRYTLVVIDMQYEFSSTAELALAGVCRAIVAAKKILNHIIVIEYKGSGDTLPEVKKAIGAIGDDWDSLIAFKSVVACGDIEDAMGCGYFDSDIASAVIVVRDDLSDDLLLSVFLHELGHYWGCRDSSDSLDVMYMWGYGVINFTDADIACAKKGASW